MAEIWIHIGTHKTGSTAIQHALRENRRWLRRQGWMFLQPPAELRELMTAQAVKEELEATGRTWMDSVARWHGRRHRLLISREGFSGNPYGGYRNVEVVAETLRRITAGHRVRIVVYLRRQDEFLESMYTQQVQEGGSRTFAEFLAACGGPPDWAALLRAYASQFGPESLMVRRYHRAFLAGAESLLRDFGDALGLAAPMPVSGSPYRNRGYSREALEFARSVNDSLDPAARAALRTLLQEASSRQAFAPFGFFSDEERAALLERCAAGHAEIAERYFPDAGGILFPPPEGKRPPRPSGGLSRETLDGILLQVRQMAREQRASAHGQEGLRRRLRRWVAKRVADVPFLRDVLCRVAEMAGWR